MYCPQCGKANPDSSTFCGSCGAQFSQSGQSGTIANPGFKKVNVWISVLLTIITLGFYLPYWFLSRNGAVNKMRSSTKLNKWPFYLVIILYILIFMTSFAAGYLEVESGTDDPTVAMFDLISALGNIISGIILIVQAFKLKRIFSDHFAAKGEQFSGIWTFFGNIWYFQHKINKLF